MRQRVSALWVRLKANRLAYSISILITLTVGILIGTVISLVTAVAATRAMLGLLAGFRWFDNARFMGASGEQKGRWLQIDFMRRRYLWFAISGVVIALSIGALAVRGLNLGIDFKGGTQIQFKTPDYVSLTNVRDQAAAIGQSDAVIQGRGGSQGDSYKSFQIRTKSLKPAAQETLSNDLETKLGALLQGMPFHAWLRGGMLRMSPYWIVLR